MISALVVTVLAFLSPTLAPVSDQVPAPAKPTVQQLLVAAEKDPAAVVPLLVEGSRAMTTLSAGEARALGDALDPFCVRAYFSSERLPGMERLGLVLHKVEKNENPTRIAGRYKIGVGMLRYLNPDFDEKKLRIGQELKVLDLSTNALAITVVKSHYRMSAWRAASDGTQVLVMFCAVGIGAPESPTPIGRTTITKRVLNPAWTDPDTKTVFAAGDPGNVLGGYWIALDAVGINRGGIGFHGYTGAPAADWIQKGASHGCVRMLQKDIDRVFHVAIEGTTVTIGE